jgi:serine/threonine-protein kinase
MSPEQAQGRPLTPASDIYSLAVILYELLTGKLPFDARTPVEFLQLHVAAKPIPIGERVPGKNFPPGLAEVIGKALLKRPEDRYRSAGEFAAALKPIASLGKGPAPLVPMRSDPVPPPLPPKPEAATTKSSRSGIGLIVGVAAACLVMGVVLAVAVMRLMH